MAIAIESSGSTTFRVTVSGPPETTHNVTAPAEYVERLAGGAGEAENLVRASFEFLLERESNTSILREFELSVIQSYFSEYEETMQRRFKR